MGRSELVRDYLLRAEKRIKAIEFLRSEGAYAERAISHAKEIMELVAKASDKVYEDKRDH